MKKNTNFLMQGLLAVCALTSLFTHADVCTEPRGDKGIRQLVDQIVIPELCSLESKLDSPCAATPITQTGTPAGKITINGPVTLTTPGYYCLAQDITASNQDGITINGSEITLDLNNYTIKNANTGIKITKDNVTVRNGTIAYAQESGISLLGNKNCRIEHVDVISSPTGFLVQNSGANTITDCRALENNAAGFSLISSNTNNIINCQALNQQGTGNVYGFVADSGTGNIFEQCLASGCTTSAPLGSGLVGGFVFHSNEINSKILSCKTTAIHSSSSDGAAFGIRIEEKIIAGDLVKTWDQNTTTATSSVDWIELSTGDGFPTSYLATGTTGGISVYERTAENALSYVTSATTSPAVNDLAWVIRAGFLDAYLAVATSSAIELYQFNADTLILTWIQSINIPSGANTVAWSRDRLHLAVGTGDGFNIYSFTPPALTFMAESNLESNITSLSWAPREDGSPYYHLVTSNDNAPFVFVFTLDSTTLQPFEEFIPYSGPALSANAAVSWNPVHTNIIGVGYENSGSAQVGLLDFNVNVQSLSPLGTPLTITPGTNTNAVDWSSSGEQLSAVTDEGAIEIFILDTGDTDQLILQANAVHTDQNIASVSFAPGDDLLAIGGNNPGDNNEVQLYQITALEAIPNHHTITNNLITKTTTNDFDGVGIRADSNTNYVAANTCCNNDIAYELVSPEYITSQANARGIYNVDCTDFTPDQVIEILNQIVPLSSQVTAMSEQVSEMHGEIFQLQETTNQIQNDVNTINNTVNLISQESWSIESKAEVISDKISLIPSQFPVTQGTIKREPLTTVTFISRPGSYFLNENMETDMYITSSGVTLDLNGFTLRGKIQTSQDLQEITIKNGTISKSLYGGIEVAYNNNLILIEKLTLATNTTIAIYNNSNNLMIKDCVFNSDASISATFSNNINIENCYFGGGNATLFLGNSNYISINNCQIASNLGFAFYKCTHVTTTNCKAIGTSIAGTEAGFLIETTEDIILTQCTALNHALGFDLVASVTGTLEKCIAERNTIGFKNADSSNTGLIKECAAVNNGTGFQDTANTLNMTYAANIARGNTTNYDFTTTFTPTPLSGDPTYWDNVEA